MRILSAFLHFIHPIIIWIIKRIYFSWFFLTRCRCLSATCCPWTWVLWCCQFIRFLFIQKVGIEVFNFSFLLLIWVSSATICCLWISCSILIWFLLGLRILFFHARYLWSSSCSHTNTFTRPQVVDHFFFILHFVLLISICLL